MYAPDLLCTTEDNLQLASISLVVNRFCTWILAYEHLSWYKFPQRPRSIVHHSILSRSKSVFSFTRELFCLGLIVSLMTGPAFALQQESKVGTNAAAKDAVSKPTTAGGFV